MIDPSEILLTGYKHWRDIGNDLLIGGLIVEVFISAAIGEHRKYKWLAELLAGVVVLVGVFIEVQNGNRADEVERRMRQASNERIAALTLKAQQLTNEGAAAQGEIAKANERAANSERDSAKANATAKEAESHLADANARAAQAQSDAASAKLAQEKLKADNLALQRLIRPRSFSMLLGGKDNQFTRLGAFAGTPLFIQFFPDAEPAKFAKGLRYIGYAGWDPTIVDENRTGQTSIDIMDGVHLYTWAGLTSDTNSQILKDQSKAWRAADALCEYLKTTSKIDCVHWIVTRHPKGQPQNPPFLFDPPANAVLMEIGERDIDQQIDALHWDEKNEYLVKLFKENPELRKHPEEVEKRLEEAFPQ